MVKEETESRSYIAIRFTCTRTKDIMSALFYSSDNYLINKDCQPQWLPSYKLNLSNNNYAKYLILTNNNYLQSTKSIRNDLLPSI